MKLGIPVYEGVDLLDVAGPYEMFKWVDANKGLKTVIVSADGFPVTSLNGIRFEAHELVQDGSALDLEAGAASVASNWTTAAVSIPGVAQATCSSRCSAAALGDGIYLA